MIQRPSDLIPQQLIDELLRLGKSWVEWEWTSPTEFKANVLKSAYLKALCRTGNDASSMAALSVWLHDGPKTFQPTQEQCEALSQIEVRLELGDYAQPYPAVFVALPPGMFSPFTGVMMYLHRGPTFTGREMDGKVALVGSLFSEGHENDIVTVVATDGRPMEVSLSKYDEDCKDVSETALRVMRVGVNSCLALVNYGCHADYLLKKQTEGDKGLARERSERGERAKQRLKTAMREVTFDREIKLHHSEGGHPSGEPTGREMTSHWRRGYWRMQAHGPQNSLRKRILVKPVLVRADRFVGELRETNTTYSS